ncbi:MAG: hypothetical protein BWY82_00332 [Verrucomicrobia bacterium ADurb.Bin474]|nr:MAG: hypothetical protein BWY82_00332 [Verrucomicrobia bacterium ADurb.Bin474]
MYSIRALIASENSPRVNTFTGRVSQRRAGRTELLRAASTNATAMASAASSAGPAASSLTPGTNQ